MNPINNLTARQKTLRKALSNRGSVSTVAVVRHIRQDGRQADGTDYHYNVPRTMGLNGCRYVVVPGRGNRLVVAELVASIPASQYPGTTEWVVGGVGRGNLEVYFGAEGQALDEARARREISDKKKELQSAERSLRALRDKSSDALMRLGLAVLIDSFTRGSLEVKARDARNAATEQARVCDNLAREIAGMESRLQ